MALIPAITISSVVMDAVVAKLSSSLSGINPLWQQQAEIYGIDPLFLKFDFTGDSSNFVLGQINPQMLEQSGDIQYPFGCLYVLEVVNSNLQKFNTFSGQVRLCLEITLSWSQVKGLQNFEVYGNCLESVVVSILNEWYTFGGSQNQAWGKPIVYNGQIQSKRAPLSFSGQNWSQKIGFSFIFEVHQQ